MIRFRSTERDVSEDLPDRLALTAMERRLEARVLLGLVAPLDEDSYGDRPESSADVGSPSRVEAEAHEVRIYGHARRIAAFLAEEFEVRDIDQKSLISELSVEMAERLLEGLEATSTVGSTSDPE